MSFETIANKVKDYAAVYDEALVMCNKIRDNASMAEHAKDEQIHKTVERYQPQIDAAAGRVMDEIDKTIAEIEAKRRKAIADGFTMADTIALAARGIRSGEYNKQMVIDMVEIYKDNPPMIEAIRAAVRDSHIPSVKELYAHIPIDGTEEQIKVLNGIKAKIAATPKLDKQSADWSVSKWKNGISISDTIRLILGLEDLDKVSIMDNIMVEADAEPEPLDDKTAAELSKIFTQKQAGILF